MFETFSYTCGRCRIATSYKKIIRICPMHGEFCMICKHKKLSAYPFYICPECNISKAQIAEDIMSKLNMFKVSLFSSDVLKIKLRDPFFILDYNSHGIM